MSRASLAATATATAPAPAPDAATEIFSVNGRAVYWPEFAFWLRYLARFYKDAHGIGEIRDWGAKQSGVDLRQYLMSTAVAYVCNDRAIEEQARLRGLGLTQAEVAEADQTRAQNIHIYGSAVEYQHIVTSMYGSEQQYDYLARIDRLSAHLFDALYGSRGEKCDSDCVARYVAEQGLMNVRYIFLANRDAAGGKPTARRRQANRTRLVGVLRQLRAGGVGFTELMRRYSEDRTLLDYPQGRLFARGTKGPAFDRAYAALADDGYSGVVEADDGDYIIQRLPISADTPADSAGTRLQYWAAYQFLYKKQITAWCQASTLTYRDIYYRLDVEALIR